MRLSRRDFLKISAAGYGALVLQPLNGLNFLQFTDTEKLGRITVGKMDVKVRPDENSQSIGAVYEDTIVPWLRETVGSHPERINQRWIETPDGHIWGGYVQPVYNTPNDPLATLPQTSLGPGMWVEVTIPYVDLILDNPPARAPWLQHKLSISLPPRFYYSQIVWVDQIRVDENGQTWYRLNEKYGSGDIFWGRAEAFRPLTEKDIEPLGETVEEKHIQVNIASQTLSCFEGTREVYYARVSSGALFDALGNRVEILGHSHWRSADLEKGYLSAIEWR